MIKKLKLITLKDVFMAMEVGEIAEAPDGVTLSHIRVTLWRLKKLGYEFTTTSKPGRILVTRLG